MYILVVGELLSGYKFYGPFETEENAMEFEFPDWPDDNYNECHWFITELIAPDTTAE